MSSEPGPVAGSWRPLPYRPPFRKRRVRGLLGLPAGRVELVTRRFRERADLGLRGAPPGAVWANNRSGIRYAAAVSKALRSEVEAGVTRGPFRDPPFPDFRVSPLGARLKESGAARIILDLSAQAGSAVNDFINPDECSISYASLDELAALIYERGGAGTYLFKTDVRAAFKLIPVRPDQHRALGFHWDGDFYYQTALPFGCRASPRLFNDFAELLRDATRVATGNPGVLNYLDDFFGVELSPPGVGASTNDFFSWLSANGSACRCSPLSA